MLSAYGGSSFAQSFLIARTGLKSGGPSYRLVEVFEQRGRWIFPDVGYIDFNDQSKYREIFIGGGREVLRLKHLFILRDVSVTEAFYLNSSTGPKSGGTLYFFPWTLISFKVSLALGVEGVYFPYLPLDSPGKVQHVVERAKVEYDFGLFKLGGGYGAYQFGDDPWQDRPFTTATLKTRRFGSLEIWLQRYKDGKQLQVRYLKKL